MSGLLLSKIGFPESKFIILYMSIHKPFENQLIVSWRWSIHMNYSFSSIYSIRHQILTFTFEVYAHLATLISKCASLMFHLCGDELSYLWTYLKMILLIGGLTIPANQKWSQRPEGCKGFFIRSSKIMHSLDQMFFPAKLRNNFLCWKLISR